MTKTHADFAPVPAPSEPTTDSLALALGTNTADAIFMGAITADRSLQSRIGFSELGGICDRRLAYRLLDAPRRSHADPLASLVGIGTHLALADLFRRRDAGSGRYLIEERVEYRGFSGAVDLYDRYQHVAIDWKTKPLIKLRRVKREGPSRQYVVQAHCYGAALKARGEDVHEVAIIYLPTDGTLADLHVWRTPLDTSIADQAIDRLIALNDRDASEVTATATPLCGWCEWHQPNSKNLSIACPGKESK